MALGPKDLVITDDETRSANHYEEKIDAVLKNKLIGHDKRVIIPLNSRAVFGASVEEPRSERVRHEIVRRYVSNGWAKVVFHHDHILFEAE